jgi:acyl-coenzyme A thioesterase PaaI-like protein
MSTAETSSERMSTAETGTDGMSTADQVADATVEERRARVADLGRALRAATVAACVTEVDDAELARAAALAQEISAILERRTRPLEQVPEVDDLERSIRVFNPVIGAGNPVSPPLEILPTDGGSVARAAFDRRFEGPPGLLHGGVIALLFDQVLGSAATLAGRWGMTAFLTVQYRRAVPLDREVVLTGRITRTEGRKTFIEGGIALAEEPDEPLATAEALIVEPRPETQAAYFGSLRDAAGVPRSARFGSDRPVA